MIGGRKKVVGVAASVAAILTAVTGIIGGFEGLRTKPYRDPVGQMTVCYGETDTPMVEYTPEECAALLRTRIVRDYAPRVIDCTPTIQDKPNALMAAVSFSYNVGSGAYCSSTMARHFKAGNIRAGCDQFKRWVYAGGRVLPGLVKRREAEADICYRDA